MSKPKPGWVAPLAGVMALLAAYVGTYYGMVRPEMQKFQNWMGASLLVITPRYPDGNDDGNGVASRVFAPAHWLDRRIRPGTWGKLPTPEEWKAFFVYKPRLTIPKSPSQPW